MQREFRVVHTGYKPNYGNLKRQESQKRKGNQAP